MVLFTQWLCPGHRVEPFFPWQSFKYLSTILTCPAYPFFSRVSTFCSSIYCPQDIISLNCSLQNVSLLPKMLLFRDWSHPSLPSASHMRIAEDGITWDQDKSNFISERQIDTWWLWFPFAVNTLLSQVWQDAWKLFEEKVLVLAQGCLLPPGTWETHSLFAWEITTGTCPAGGVCSHEKAFGNNRRLLRRWYLSLLSSAWIGFFICKVGMSPSLSGSRRIVPFTWTHGMTALDEGLS